MKPALTPEEWQRVLREGAAVFSSDRPDSLPFNPQAIAATALHRQPFGFTWDDVDECRAVAARYEPEWDEVAKEEVGDFHVQKYWNDLADRIAALLPPRET